MMGQASMEDNKHPRQALPISVVILTYNEERNIGPAIRSCAWCDDIHVLDSGSKDQTCEIARSMGAKIWVNKFESFGQQRNWAIDNIPCKHPWHFHLDADERYTNALVHEMAEELGPDGTRSKHAAYLVPNRMIFMGKWVRFAGGFPAYQVRLIRHGKCRFMDFGHGQREQTNGTIGRMKEAYIHFNFSKGLVEWMTKHNQYSNREGAEGLIVRQEKHPIWAGLHSDDPIVRRRAMKNLSYFLHGRGLLRFLDLFFLRGGWRDGKAGFHYSAMIGMYEHWIELKIAEKESSWRQATDALAERLLQEPAK
jgi:glycosyltransferase involved in cell wall biosynthesis